MKVKAVQMGFRNGRRVKPGSVFVIPDSPKRKLKEEDGPVVRALADKKGEVPAEFAEGWMRVVPKDVPVTPEPEGKPRPPSIADGTAPKEPAEDPPVAEPTGGPTGDQDVI